MILDNNVAFIKSYYLLEREGRGINMKYIGSEVCKRMNILDIDAKTLADGALLDEEFVKDILDDKISLEEINELDLVFLCSVLHCKSEVFIDDSVKSKDLLMRSLDGDNDNRKTIAVKAKIQDFVNDFLFVEGLLAENDLRLENIRKISKNIVTIHG